MVFLPGVHALDVNITVANVSSLTLHGQSSSANIATIVCRGSVGLSFTSMVEFKIHSLAFTSCSRKYATPPASSFALLLQSTQNAVLVNSFFHDNLGTALVVNNASVTLAEKNEFINNSADYGGGIYASDNAVLSINGTTNFINNSAAVYGGAIFTLENVILSFNGTSNFINNSASNSVGGAIYTSHNTLLSFNGATNFISNSAGIGGGAIYTLNNNVLHFNGINNFTDNSALYGGAVYTMMNAALSYYGTNNFISNSAAVLGGAIYALNNTALSFNGISSFTGNSALVYGGAICADFNSTLTCNGTTNFANNGGVTGTLNLHGGGVWMGLKSIFYILRKTTVYWENNHANVGGAIYILDTSPISYCEYAYIPRQDCFFQLPDQNPSSIDVQLVFKNNSADVAGSVLFGGAIDNCRLTGLDSYSSGEVFDSLLHIDDDNTNSTISSNPLHICPCEHGLSDCSMSEYYVPFMIHPGETFHIAVVAAGQRNGALPSMVRGTVVKKDTANQDELLGYQYIQQASNTCTKLNYTVFSLSTQVDIKLYAEDSPCPIFDDQYINGVLQLHVIVNLNQTCPHGFNISESARSCVCEPRLAKYAGIHQCTITNGVGEITRQSNQYFWVGYNNQSHGLILHPQCPFDYCVNDTVVFALNNTDVQCAYNRSGLLCGACRKGHSLVLGSSHCKQCTSNSLVLLIPFALMGVALVFFLLICKLTVATGTLSGLVFYANIVEVNRTIFLPGESTDARSVFIAWLNLDFGIETCFYNGMDTYSKIWLQFVFPIYIWIIIGLIILVSNYSRRFTNLLGKNPVSVLATLTLLSYTKILRTLIAVLYITYLEYPTYERWVWLYDGNIDYFSGKHIPLFLVAVVVFFFLFLPYTLLLLFGQWLQAISHLRLFSWVNSARLKPFMDSYHAPYKAKHRYWPGLLLALRFVLLLVIALNLNINLVAILVGSGFLQLWAWISGGVYRNWYLDALEGSFSLNLIILAASTYHVNLSGGNELAIGYTSVSIAFITFIGIVAFQLVNVTGVAQYLKRKYTELKVATTVRQANAQLTGSLPHRLMNPEEYDPSLYSPQEQATAEPTEDEGLINENQRRLVPVYTYGSVS